MEFTGPRATTRAPAEWFTGDGWFDVLHVGTAPSRLRANLTRFAPGARTRHG